MINNYRNKFTSFNKYKYFPQVLLIGVVLLVYAQNLWFDLAYLDDNLIVIKEYEKIDSVLKIPNAFISGYLLDNYYRPMVIISFIVDTAIAGQSSMIYHLTNLILHICVSLLLFNLLIKFKIKQSIALLIALIFALHPINTNAVSWIVGRNDLLLAFFSLVSFLFFMRFTEKEKLVYLFLSNFFYLFAVLSKEVGFLLPVVFTVYYVFFVNKENSDKKFFIIPIYFTIPAGIYIILRWFISEVIIRDEISIKSFIQNFYILFEYLGKLLYLPAIEPLPIKNPILIAIGLMFTILLLFVLIRLKFDPFNKKLFSFGLIFFLIFILPSLLVRIKSLDGQFNYIDCRIYLPLIGICISLGIILQLIRFDKTNKLSLVTIVTLLFAYIISFTFIKNQMYSDGKNFWGTSTKLHPKRADYWIGLGSYYYNKKDFSKSAYNFEKAILINPRVQDYYFRAATAYSEGGEFHSAIKPLEAVLKLNVNKSRALLGLIQLNLQIGDSVKAVESEKEMISIAYEEKDANYISLASEYYLSAKNFNKAINLMQMAIEIEPRNDKYYYELGLIFFKVGKLESAKKYFFEATKLNPTNKTYLTMLSSFK